MNDSDVRVSRFEAAYKEGKRKRDNETKIANPVGSGDLDSPWYYYDRMVRGYQWDLLSDMSSWASRPVKNMAFMGVLSYTTLLTDSNPSIGIQAVESGDSELAELVKGGVEYWWADQYMQKTTALAVMASRIFSVGWLHLYHDADKGECCKFVHPESLYVDEDCTADDFDPTYMVYEYRAQIGELEARYPDVKFNDFIPGWKVGWDSANRVQYDRYEDNRNPALSTTVYEFWTKDPERIVWYDDEVLDGKRVKKSKAKFPGGRKLTIAGGIVLEDIANPYDHGEFPFTPVLAYPIPGRFYGVSDIQGIFNIQVMRNRMSQYIYDQTVRSGGGYVLVGRQSGIPADKVTNAPLQVLPCNDVNQFRVEKPLQPSRHVFEYIAMLDGDADDIMGLHDISRGVRSPGNPVTAQEAMILAESDRTRVRMGSRWLAWSIERVGRQLLSNLEQFKGFEWFVRIAEKDETTKLTGDMLKDHKFDLRVADSSTLPTAQQEGFNKVQMLLSLGVITPQNILKYKLIDIPHADEILADNEKAEQLAMQQTAGAPPTGEVPMGLPPMEAPAEQALPPDALMGGIPEGANPDEIMAIVQEISSTMGISPEEVLATIGGA